MHLSTQEYIAGTAAVLAVWMCGLTQVRLALRGLAAQTALLAVATAALGLERHAPYELLLAAVVLVVKAGAIPAYLAWAAGRLDIRRDAGALLSPTLSMLAGLGLLATGFFLAPRFATPASGHAGMAGMALALVFSGMLLMLTRRLALSQLIGFLVMENGIFLYSLTQTAGMPMIVEMGVVFDVLVGVLVAGLVIFRLNRSFEHIDVTQLRGLRN
ncbi:MAG TPA: hypothetical protein VGM37_21355 [Armatimonadota bacterium]|jgi:hydrogenase-4 component E